jgi:hypothetical protein
VLQVDQQEFDAQIQRMFAGALKHCSAEHLAAYWTGLHTMALSDVARVVDSVLRQEGETKVLTPGRFWGALRDIKARREVPLAVQPATVHFHGDIWDIRANRHLLGFITEKATHRVYFCSEAVSSCRISAGGAWQDQETVELMAVLLEHKGYWAQEMREFEDDDAIPADMGRAQWNERMGYAMAQTAAIRERYAAKQQAAA